MAPAHSLCGSTMTMPTCPSFKTPFDPAPVVGVIFHQRLYPLIYRQTLRVSIQRVKRPVNGAQALLPFLSGRKSRFTIDALVPARVGAIKNRGFAFKTLSKPHLPGHAPPLITACSAAILGNGKRVRH